MYIEDKSIYSKNFQTNLTKEYEMILKYEGKNVFFGGEIIKVKNSKDFFKYVVKYLDNTDVDIIIKKKSGRFYLFSEVNSLDEVVDAISFLPILYNKKEENTYQKKLN